MLDRLRAFARDPLDARFARAVLAAGIVAFAGLAVLGLAALGARPARQGPAPAVRPTSLFPWEAGAASAVSGQEARLRPQDPQDRPGSAAARRARRTLAAHRALQHVPYRRRALAVFLIGARDGRAILRVSAPSVAEARRGWRSFLSRYGDSGRAYLPRFEGRGGRHG